MGDAIITGYQELGVGWDVLPREWLALSILIMLLCVWHIARQRPSRRQSRTSGVMWWLLTIGTVATIGLYLSWLVM